MKLNKTTTKTESKRILVSICSKNPRAAAKMVEEELAQTGEVIKTIHRKFMPKCMNHADVVIQANIVVPSTILARYSYMGKLMGKINAKISGICWYTWNKGSS